MKWESVSQHDLAHFRMTYILAALTMAWYAPRVPQPALIQSRAR